MLRCINNRKISLLGLALILTVFTGACVNSDDMERPTPQENAPKTDVSDIAGPDVSSDPGPAIRMYDGIFELPVTGATGYAPVKLNLKSSATADSETIGFITEGTGFKILDEEADWWLIESGDLSGWLEHQYAFINLPDVIPSIIYDNTNTYSSQFASSGKSLPGISNAALYSGKTFNERLKREEFIMPVLYTMAKKIQKAQEEALIEGDSLKIYEGFRPYSVQKAVVKGLTDLANHDAEVKAGINTPPWGITWFIVDGVSNHQLGYGIDVSLVKIVSKEDIAIGDYSSIRIIDYKEYEMPTQIHELSSASAVFTEGVTSKSATAWKNAVYTASMTEGAKRLQKYNTNAGMTPLASEWWHFNDLEAREETANNRSTGNFILQEIYSSIPVLE